MEGGESRDLVLSRSPWAYLMRSGGSLGPWHRELVRLGPFLPPRVRSGRGPAQWREAAGRPSEAPERAGGSQASWPLDLGGRPSCLSIFAVLALKTDTLEALESLKSLSLAAVSDLRVFCEDSWASSDRTCSPRRSGVCCGAGAAPLLLHSVCGRELLDI